ncbi:hypothetical protein GF351_05780 [Candidatus Woesearchaeota archaeon]|nr:hypothetical protein [Candidatus Woesearchaeota archaeon]
MLILLLVALVVLHPYVRSWDHFLYYSDDSDTGNFVMSNHLAIRESVHEHGQFPFWNIYVNAGTPLFAGPQVGVISVVTLFNLLLPFTSLGALKLAMMLLYLLAGISMYLLMLDFKLKPRYAFLAALVYMINGSAGYLFYVYDFWSTAYALLPFTILFAKKAFESKEWIMYACISGLLLAVVFLSGSVSGFLYNSMLLSLFVAYRVFGRNLKKRASKAALVFLLVFIVAGGLISVKALPAMNFVEDSSRSAESGFDYDFYLGQGHHITANTAYRYLIKDHDNPFPTASGGTGQIGYVALLLALCSLPLFKKKRVLFFHLAVIFLLLYMTRSPISWLVWKLLPVFNQQRSVDKALYLYNFAVAALVGFGASLLMSKAKRRLHISNKASKAVLAGIMIIFFVDMAFVNLGSVMLTGEGLSKHEKANDWRFGSFYDYRKEIREQALLQDITSDPGLFRIRLDEVNALMDGANSYTVPMGLQSIYGNGNIFQQEYPTFPILAYQTGELAKMLGMLNVRYLVSRTNVTYEGFELEGYYEIPKGPSHRSKSFVSGPYLFKNSRYLPRAYHAENAILVLADTEENARQAVYYLLLHPLLDPARTAVITSRGPLSSYTPEELEKYDVIFVVGGADDLSLLRDYEGAVIPDITAGESQLTDEDISQMLSSLSNSTGPGDEEPDAAEYLKYTPNKVVISAKNRGWLVLSEKYSLFEGWHAYYGEAGSMIRIEKADAILSAVYLEGPGDVRFAYVPKGFNTGAAISAVTLLLLLAYWAYSKKYKKAAKDKTEKGNHDA